jgi:hypothetical protein
MLYKAVNGAGAGDLSKTIFSAKEDPIISCCR